MPTARVLITLSLFAALAAGSCGKGSPGEPEPTVLPVYASDLAAFDALHQALDGVDADAVSESRVSGKTSYGFTGAHRFRLTDTGDPCTLAVEEVVTEDVSGPKSRRSVTRIVRRVDLHRVDGASVAAADGRVIAATRTESDLVGASCTLTIDDAEVPCQAGTGRLLSLHLGDRATPVADALRKVVSICTKGGV